MIAQKSQKSPKNGQKWNFFLAKEQCRKNEYVFGWSIGSGKSITGLLSSVLIVWHSEREAGFELSPSKLIASDAQLQYQ